MKSRKEMFPVDEIVVKVSDLFEITEQLHQDGMQYVRLMLLEAEDDFPASISVKAIENASSDNAVDYECIESVENIKI